jgi:hypothetical protein
MKPLGGFKGQEARRRSGGAGKSWCGTQRESSRHEAKENAQLQKVTPRFVTGPGTLLNQCRLHNTKKHTHS